MQQIHVQGNYYGFKVDPVAQDRDQIYAVVTLLSPGRSFEMKGTREELAKWFELLAEVLSP